MSVTAVQRPYRVVITAQLRAGMAADQIDESAQRIT
jgi:hypothetical protein